MMPLDICVVGSGIGGLACGIALADKGHNVTILEATKKMQAVGGIIIIMPNAERILDEWGVYPSILEICSDNPVPGYQRNYKHGEIIAKFPVDQMEEKLGFPIWNMHRADYQRVLCDAAIRKGIKIRLNAAVTAVDEVAPSVTLKSGEVIKADLVIASDGFKSVVRDAINRPEERNVTDSGIDVTRLNLPWKIMLADPDLEPLTHELSLWYGPGHGVAQMPMLHQDEWWQGFDFHHPRYSHSLPDRAVPMSLVELKKHYSNWCPQMRKVLEYCEDLDIQPRQSSDSVRSNSDSHASTNGNSNSITTTSSDDRHNSTNATSHPPLPPEIHLGNANLTHNRLQSSSAPKHPAYVWQMHTCLPKHWTSPKTHLVVLVGDAAHSMVPHTGQGSGMAVEDAATIAECLERRYDALTNPTGPSIGELMRTYQTLREPRCARVQAMANERCRGMLLLDEEGVPLGEDKVQAYQDGWSSMYDELGVRAAGGGREDVEKSESQDVRWDPRLVDEIPSDGKDGAAYMMWQNGFDAIGYANRRLDEIYGPLRTT